MADFTLIVGLDTVLSYKTIQPELNAIVRLLNKNPPKVKVELDPRSLTTMQQQVKRIGADVVGVGVKTDTGPLQELIRLVGELNQKDYSINIDVSDANTAQEALGRYRESVRDYIRELSDAYKAIGSIVRSASWKSNVGQSMNKELAALSGIDYMKNIKEYEQRLDRVSSFAGAERIAKDAQQAWSYLMPLLNKAQELQIITANSKFGIFPELPKESIDTASRISDILSQISGRAQDVGSAMSAEGQKVIDATEQFAEHGASVQEAVRAERDKQLQSKDLSGALEQESAALKDVKSAADAEAKSEEIQLKKIADAATKARALLESNMEASGGASYQKLTAELEKAERVLQMCGGDSTRLKEALESVGVNGDEVITRLNTSVSTLKNELKQSGEQGTVSLRQIITMATQMQALINNNPGMQGSAQYSDLISQLTAFNNIIAACNGDTERLQDVLHNAGLSGATAMEKARTATAAFKHELGNAARAAKDVADAETKDTGGLANMRKRAAAEEKYRALIIRSDKALRNWTAAEHSKNESSRIAYEELKRSTDAARTVSAAMDDSAESTARLETANRNLQRQYKESEQIIRANGDATKTLGERIGGLAKKFSSWLTASQIIMFTVRAMRQAVQASIELESAFAQLQIVTGANAEKMTQFKEAAVAMSKELGKSVSDVTKSIEVFSRLGYSLDEASTLAKYATIMANVAGVDTESATTGLTSIIKGFNMDVEDAAHVADVLVEVGQKYAVSAGEMMEAYERSGAALNATNTSFEKSAGLIAAANAAVQDSSVVGTALKTISARIRGSKSDLDSLGESAEDLADGFSKYADEIKALTGFDIMIDGTTNSFKDLYDIMAGIASVWDKLTDTQRARVSEILGGTRQLQVISSILGNFKDAAGAYDDAMTSVGAATKANDIYMQTSEAHINQFKSSFQALSYDMINGELISGLADIGSGLLGFIDTIAKATNALGALPAVMGTVLAALSVKNVGELTNQFQPLIILRVEYAHEALTNGNMNETMRTLAA